MVVNFNGIDFAVLNTIGDAARFTAEDKGFVTGEGEQGPEIDRKLLLAVSEICEAQEELRDGRAPTEIYFEANNQEKAGQPKKPEGFPIEIADAIIRLLQLCRSQGVDIAAAVEMKMKFNLTRPNKHGRQF